MNDPDWFRALLDTSADVFFRYSLQPARRFVYLSPSVFALTGHDPQAFYDDARLCVGLIVREDRALLKQVLRARRGLTLTMRIARNGTVIPVTLRTAIVVRQRHVVAIEGVVVAMAAASQAVPAPVEPTQQRLAALMYEVHDLLHRVLPPPAPSRPATSDLRVGDLVLDPDRMRVTEKGEHVTLTTREIMVLRYFLERQGRVVTREQLLTDVWGNSYTGDDRTVDVHISRIRRKLPSVRARLVALKHVGYRLDCDDAETAVSF